MEMNFLYNYFLIIFVNFIPYCCGCFPTQQSDSGPNVVTGSMTGGSGGSGGSGSPGTTLPNDPTCQCGAIPTSGNLIATPPIVIINPFTCLITVTLQCLPLAFPPAQRLQFNGDNTYLPPTPPPFTVTCGGTGEYTYIRPPLTLTVLTSVTCVV